MLEAIYILRLHSETYQCWFAIFCSCGEEPPEQPVDHCSGAGSHCCGYGYHHHHHSGSMQKEQERLQTRHRDEPASES